MGGNGTVVSWKGVINGVEVFQPKGLKNPGVHTGPGLSFTVRKLCGEVSLGSFGLGYLSRGMSVFFGFPLLFSEFSTHFGEVIWWEQFLEKQYLKIVLPLDIYYLPICLGEKWLNVFCVPTQVKVVNLLFFIEWTFFNKLLLWSMLFIQFLNIKGSRWHLRFQLREIKADTNIATY